MGQFGIGQSVKRFERRPPPFAVKAASITDVQPARAKRTIGGRCGLHPTPSAYPASIDNLGGRRRSGVIAAI
jgi:hypothetical protein